MAELKFAGNVRRLRMRPGDWLVLEADSDLTIQQVEDLRLAVRSRFPDNEVMILGGGLRASAVLRPEEVSCG